jgi:predicted nuclease of restriction endonuclease-like (RecB) superfamily
MLYSSTIGFQKLEDYHKEMLTLISSKDSLNFNIVMKDPYMLEFFGLTIDYSEPDFVDNIIKLLENFILDSNTGFSLVARQKRMTIKDNHYWLDLVFYQRKLHRIVAFDVVSDDGIDHKQQMRLYLHWLKKYESNDNENSPLGVIINLGKSNISIEFCNIDPNEKNITEAFQKTLSINKLTTKLQDAICVNRYKE